MTKTALEASGPTQGALINGKWVNSSAGTFEVRSPHTGEVLHEVGKCSSADVERAVASSKAAYPSWAATPVIERAKILRRIHALFLERAEPMAQMIVS